MRRRFLQLVFGLALGFGAQASLPGRHPGGVLLVGGLSLLGAAGGGALAEAILPRAYARRGGFILAGMGAIAMLLIQAVAAG